MIKFAAALSDVLLIKETIIMLKNYETVFILNPVLSEEQTKETVGKFTSFLKERGAELVNEEFWGLRKLAYPIQKKKSGFYYMLEFKSEGHVINDFEIEFRRDERIMRFLTVAMDKYASAYADKRRAAKSNAKKEDN